jgi:hypothetical protein
MADILAYLTAKPEVTNAISAMASAALALLAFLISLLSLFVARATLKHQLKHNVMSLKPLPFIAPGDYENHLFVKLRNDGPGPLIVRRLSVRSEQTSETTDALINLMPNLPDGLPWDTYVGPIAGRSIPSLGELMLLELTGDEGSVEYCQARDQVRAALSKTEVLIEYTDVYESSYNPYTKRLDWFAGHNVSPDAKRKR